jgi:O-antigen/teichoic acid export membrane protein
MLVLRARDAFSPEQSTNDLAGRSIRGGAISVVGQMTQLLLQVGGTAVLARLLTPRDFGLVAMVTAISIFGMILRDAGLSMATIQARRITQDQCARLFRVNAAAGVFLGACLAGAAPLVARFYGHDELTWITLGFAAPLALSGFVTQHFALLQRNMMFGAVTICQIGFYFSYWVGAVASALLGLGYWSLVIGNAAAYVVWVALISFFCRWLPTRPAKGTAVWELVRFGGHVLGSSVVYYISGNADTILVGKFLGAGPVGLYTRACNFVALPIAQIRDLIMRVGLPVLRLLVDQPERFRRYQTRMTGIVATVSFPLGLVCILEGGFFIQALLGRQWLEATTAFRVFGAVMVVRPVVATVELALLSLGESRRYLIWNVVTSVVYVASFAAGLHWGITGVAAAYAIANLALVLPAAAYCLARSPVAIRDFLSQLLVPIGVGCLAGGVLLAFHVAVGYDFAEQGVGVVLFIVLYCGLSIARPSVRELVRSLRGARHAEAG